jgi:hypothetical protein
MDVKLRTMESGIKVLMFLLKNHNGEHMQSTF